MSYRPFDRKCIPLENPCQFRASDEDEDQHPLYDDDDDRPPMLFYVEDEPVPKFENLSLTNQPESSDACPDLTTENNDDDDLMFRMDDLDKAPVTRGDLALSGSFELDLSIPKLGSVSSYGSDHDNDCDDLMFRMDDLDKATPAKDDITLGATVQLVDIPFRGRAMTSVTYKEARKLGGRGSPVRSFDKADDNKKKVEKARKECEKMAEEALEEAKLTGGRVKTTPKCVSYKPGEFREEVKETLMDDEGPVKHEEIGDRIQAISTSLNRDSRACFGSLPKTTVPFTDVIRDYLARVPGGDIRNTELPLYETSGDTMKTQLSPYEASSDTKNPELSQFEASGDTRNTEFPLHDALGDPEDTELQPYEASGVPKDTEVPPFEAYGVAKDHEVPPFVGSDSPTANTK